MRVVIKPFGLALLLIAMVGGLLVIVLLPRLKNTTATPATNKESSPTPIAVASVDPNNLFVDPQWHLYVENIENPAKGTMARIRNPDAPGQIVYHYDITQIGKKQWNIGVTHNFPQETFAAEEPLTIHFEAKSPEHMQICLLMQRNSAPFPHSWKKNIKLTPEWQPYDLTLKTDQYGPNEGVFAIQLGLMTGTMDIKNLHMERKH